jgi:hypothetical protein
MIGLWMLNYRYWWENSEQLAFSKEICRDILLGWSQLEVGEDEDEIDVIWWGWSHLHGRESQDEIIVF